MNQMKIAYWQGCLVKVLKEFTTGERSIEVNIPGKISYIFLVDKSELSEVHLKSI